MQETKPRLRPLKTAQYLLLGILLCAVVGLVCFFGGRASAGGKAENTKLDAVVLETRLSELRELATVSYRYTNMAQFQNSSDFYGVKIPFTTKRFILTYDGEIKAGVDLSLAQVEVCRGRPLPSAYLRPPFSPTRSMKTVWRSLMRKPAFSTPSPWRTSPPFRPIKNGRWKRRP